MNFTQNIKSSNTNFWDEAPMIKLLLPLVLIVTLKEFQLIPTFQLKWLLIGLLGACSLFALNNSINKNGFLKHSFTSILIPLQILIIGIISYQQNDITNHPNWFGKELAKKKLFSVSIVEKPIEKLKTWKLKVNIDQSYDGFNTTKSIGNGFIYVYKSQTKMSLDIGDKLIIPNEWKPIKNSGNPFEFNYAKNCLRNGITHQIFLSESQFKVLPQTKKELTWIQKTHQWAMNALAQNIKDEKTLGLMQAMLLGENVQLDQDLRQTYAETGVIHIVAISGGHIVVFFGFIQCLFFWLKNRRFEWIKYLFALPLIWFYVLVAGAPISAVRAAIMFSLITLGLIMGKNKNAMNQLFTTAFLMILFYPSWLFSIGFQLSFLAVLSLIIFYQPIADLLKTENKIGNILWKTAAASIAVELLVAPLVAYYFHIFPIGFIAANIIAYCFMGVALLAGIFIVLLSNFTFIASLLSSILVFFAKWFHLSMVYIQTWNWAALKQIQINILELVVVIITIAFCSYACFFRNGKAFLFSQFSFLLLIILFNIDSFNISKQHKLVVYNSKDALIEEIIGIKGCNAIYSSITDTTKNNYFLNNAHIGFGVKTSETKSTNANFWNVGNKQIALLNIPIVENKSAKIKLDYLIAAQEIDSFELEKIQNNFDCKKIIVVGKQSKKSLNQILSYKHKCRIPIHITSEDGSCIID